MKNENEFQSNGMNKTSGSKNHLWAILAALVLLVVILFGGYYLLKNLKKPKIEPQPTINEPFELNVIKPPTPEPEEKEVTKKAEVIIESPDSVVEKFYNWYQNYEGDSIKEELESQSSLSTALAQKLKNNSDKIDPVLCAEEKPSKIETEPSKINGGNASVIVNENFSGEIKSVKVNLAKKGNEWQMISIICLSEDGIRSILENLKSELDLDYATVKDMNLTWNIPDYKGLKEKAYKGMGFSVKNAVVNTSVLKKFFEKNQFEKNINNADSYEKDKIMCLVNDVLNEEKHDLSIVCAER